MPPIPQQGSRAGLITFLIISVVLLVVSLATMAYINAERNKLETANNEMQRKYNKVVRADQMPEGSDVSTLEAGREKLLNLPGNATTVDVALEQIRELTKVVSGTPDTRFDPAEKKAVDAVSAAAKALNPGQTVPTTSPSGGLGLPGGESLVGMIGKLTTAVTEKDRAITADKATIAKLNADLKTRMDGWTAQYEELNKKFAEADARAQAAEKGKTDAEKIYQDKQVQVDASNKSTVESTSAQVAGMQTQLAQAQADLAKVVQENSQLKSRMGNYRLDVKDSVVRQPDGNIIRVPSQTSCYINLGQADHLPVGITFEVYDKGEGVPGLGKDSLAETNLPVGKASIEVVRVGQNSSECRIVHMQPGATLSEGDVIANLVYDRNTTFHFVVYGNFDVDGNGVWTPQEADVVKSLVTRWGGKLDDKIGISTDFVVLGQEPQVPALTKQELEDPILKDKYDKAVVAQKAWQSQVETANNFNIPIMNQNRFMYYTGYFDQMKR
jgi:hypothetical protein